MSSKVTTYQSSSTIPSNGNLKRTKAIISGQRPYGNNADNTRANPNEDALAESIEHLSSLLQQLDIPPIHNHEKELSTQMTCPQRTLQLPQGEAYDKSSNLAMARELDELLLSLEQIKTSSSDYTPLESANPQQEQSQRDLSELLNYLRVEMTNLHSTATPSSGQICAACGETIVSEWLSALGHSWHADHFTCASCKDVLCLQNFYERNGQAFCENCHLGLYSPKCAYCEQPILDKCLTAMNHTWHPEHFFCASCQCFFDEQIGFHERDSKPYCPDCFYANFGLKCSKCKKAITAQYVTALNSYWHHACFVCQECLQPFPNGTFYEVNGLPYCEPHFHAKRGSLCHACQQPVTGRCINAMGRKFHPQHFVCSFCRRELTQGTFKEHKEAPYCHECFIKRFS